MLKRMTQSLSIWKSSHFLLAHDSCQLRRSRRGPVANAGKLLNLGLIFGATRLTSVK